MEARKIKFLAELTPAEDEALKAEAAREKRTRLKQLQVILDERYGLIEKVGTDEKAAQEVA